ncbi:MAG: flippase-like domain-containing protein [Candidatus Delongbacteria bacterium]|nr:flippase-like domain-containing protein [Candidatus Delongbacteria bacterium]
MKKSHLLFTGKILLTLFLFWLIIKQIEGKNLLQYLDAVNFYYFGLTILLALMTNIFHIIRWKILLQAKNPTTPSWLKLLKYHFFGLFIQLFLPSTLSGDLVKAYRLSKSTDNKLESFSTVMFARLMGLILYIVMGILIVILYPGTIRILPFYLILCTLGIYTAMTVMLVLIFMPSWSKSISHRLEFRLWKKGWETIHGMQQSFLEYRHHRSSIIQSLIITFLIYLSMILVTITTFRSFGITLPFSLVFAYTPIIYIIQLIPITPNGTGIREWSMLLFYQSAGITSESIIMYAIVGYGSIVLVNLLGGLTIIYDAVARKN